MEISVIEVVLRHAVQRGVLDADDVNAAVDQMWGARNIYGGCEAASDNASGEGKQNGAGPRGVQRGIDGRSWPLKYGCQ
jgi:hypothetical protein